MVSIFKKLSLLFLILSIPLLAYAGRIDSENKPFTNADETDSNAWLKTGDQSSLSGTKSGTFGLSTSGILNISGSYGALPFVPSNLSLINTTPTTSSNKQYHSPSIELVGNVYSSPFSQSNPFAWFIYSEQYSNASPYSSLCFTAIYNGSVVTQPFFVNSNGNAEFLGTLSAGAITGTSIIKSGGLTSQFLKANGDVDSNTYYKSGDSPSFVRGTFTEPTLSPFVITSTVVNTNLNADLLDGQHASYYMPVGAIMEWGTYTAPTGWLLCDGSAVSRTTYADLFSAIAPSKGAFTVSIASPAVLSLTGHGMRIGDQFYATTTGALPTGMTANTLYYIISTSFGADSFKFSASRGGDAVNTSGTQSGTHTLVFCPYGLGNGSTTFNVPDFRARFTVGYNTSDTNFGYMGQIGGATTNTATLGAGSQVASYTNVYSTTTGAFSILPPYKTVNRIIKY